MNLYYKMLRMKSRKRTKKMRGGGIFGPKFTAHIDKSQEQFAYGAGKILSGWDKTKEVGRQGMHEAQTEYYKRIKQPTGVTGGTPPLPTTTTTSLQPLPPIHKPHRPVLYSPTQDSLTLVQQANNPTGTIIGRGGKRKTKKRRRKRKKKKTKRKKRRRKRKTKKRRRR